MIRLIGKDGFEVTVDPDRITAFGIEHPSPSLWIRVDGREFVFTDQVKEQYDILTRVVGKDKSNMVGINP